MANHIMFVNPSNFSISWCGFSLVHSSLPLQRELKYLGLTRTADGMFCDLSFLLCFLGFGPSCEEQVESMSCVGAVQCIVFFFFGRIQCIVDWEVLGTTNSMFDLRRFFNIIGFHKTSSLSCVLLWFPSFAAALPSDLEIYIDLIDFHLCSLPT